MKIEDREKRRLNGPVRTVRTITAEYDENLVERPCLLLSETFDEQGRLSEMTFHNYRHPEHSSKSVFSYDAAGNLLDIEQSFQDQSGRSGGKSPFGGDSDAQPDGSDF